MKNVINSVLLLLIASTLGGWRTLAAEADAQPAKPAAKPADLFADAVVAKGKNCEVKRSQVDDAMSGLKSTYAARGQNLSADDIAQAEPHVLQRLIQIQLLLAKATDPDKAEAKEAATKRIDEMRSRLGNDENFNRQLKSVGTTQDELRNKMIEETTAEAVLERELKVSVTPDDIKKFYDENPAKFEQPEMVRASHILLSTRNPDTNADLPEAQKTAKHKLAEDLLKRARAGEDFAKLAKEYSEDPGSKDKGGEYQFPRGQMVPEFEAAAFSLKTNEVSDIVTTQFGYHIIKLSEKIPAKKLDLGKVSPDIREYLKQQQMQKRQQDLKDYFAKLEKDANVQILDEKLKIKEVPDTLPEAAKKIEVK
jgi:peptidyl-prolyl cis-trans isomerase C